MNNFVTSGDITRNLAEAGYDVDLADVAYALRRMKVRPLAVAGITRLFAPGAIEQVREFIVSRRKEATRSA